MVADVRAEAHRGRFSVLGEFLYMSLSDGIGTNTVVKKIDVRVDQTMADFGVAWRILENPRGYVDVTSGVRYSRLYQRLTLQPNDERIDGAVDGLAAVVGSQLRSRVAAALQSIEGRDPTLPVSPLDADAAARLAAAVAKIKGTLAERKAQIKERLHDALDRTVARTDDWFDPYIGLRGRYNLSDKFYLTAKGDIGGFGVGSDLSWTAEAALGCQLSPRVSSEVGYRAYGVDYEKDGLLMDTITHGRRSRWGSISDEIESPRSCRCVCVQRLRAVFHGLGKAARVSLPADHAGRREHREGARNSAQQTRSDAWSLPRCRGHRGARACRESHRCCGAA